MVQMYTHQTEHPLCNGVPTITVVYEYKLSAARELAALSREFGLTGGSKGGSGVSGAAVADKAKDGKGATGGARGGSGGQSAAADDDDT
jgi:hypothetical protein